LIGPGFRNRRFRVQGSEVQGSEVQGSAHPLVAEAAGLIEKETLKKQILQRRTNIEH
jgi:hypothetical protein